MRIKKLYIENFGGLSDRLIEMTGCTRIVGKNGFGKSTTAAFIRIMLYGFEGESKRTIIENERKRWEPWQGGVYGGSMTFEEKGKVYTVRRTFGRKAIEDTFELIDEATNLPSDDYSTELGRELMGVDSQSYMRSAYIGQNDVITNTTGDINNKIGNIADNTKDLDCYDKAHDKIADLLNKRHPVKATGSIRKHKDSVAALRQKVNAGNSIEDTLHQQDDMLRVLTAEYDGYDVKIGECEALSEKIAKYKDISEKLSTHDKYEEDVNNSKKQIEDELEAFGVLPLESDIDEKLSVASGLSVEAENIADMELNEEEKSEYEALKDKFYEKPMDRATHLEITGLWRGRDMRLLDEQRRESEFSVLRNERDAVRLSMRTLPKDSIVGIIMIIASMLMAILSLVILPSNTLRLIGSIVSAVVLIAGIIITVFSIKKRNARANAECDELEARLSEMEKKITEDIRSRNDMDKRVKDYLTEYGCVFREETALDELLRLQDEARKYDDMSKRLEDIKDKKRELEDKKRMLATFVTRWNYSIEDDFVTSLKDLMRRLNTYQNDQKTLEKQISILREYDESNNIEELRQVEKPDESLSLAQLAEKIRSLRAARDEVKQKRDAVLNQRKTMMENFDEWVNDKELLATEEESLRLEEKNYELLKLSGKYLTEAKEAMTAKYMKPLMDSFAKYYSKISGKDASEYNMDANIEISTVELGHKRDVRLYSVGCQDLVGFCMRMALVDAMYKEDKPVLILDDPFVNFDSERKQAADALLKEITKTYQVVYFTCL